MVEAKHVPTDILDNLATLHLCMSLVLAVDSNEQMRSLVGTVAPSGGKLDHPTVAQVMMYQTGMRESSTKHAK